MNKSNDMNAKDALASLEELNSVEEIQAFIEGDDRKSVIDAVAQRILKLQGTKQGKQGKTENITKDVSDFKVGVQKTKAYVTCEDVLNKMRAEGKDI